MLWTWYEWKSRLLKMCSRWKSMGFFVSYTWQKVTRSSLSVSSQPMSNYNIEICVSNDTYHRVELREVVMVVGVVASRRWCEALMRCTVPMGHVSGSRVHQTHLVLPCSRENCTLIDLLYYNVHATMRKLFVPCTYTVPKHSVYYKTYQSP